MLHHQYWYLHGTKNIPKEVSLGIEKLVDGDAEFKDFGPIEGFQYLVGKNTLFIILTASIKQLIRSRMRFRFELFASFN